MPWELIKIGSPHNPKLVGVVSVRKKEIAISRDLVDKYFKMVFGFSKIQMFINRESGELGLHPNEEGYSLKGRRGKTSCVLNLRRFLKKHPIKTGRYVPRWDAGNNFLVIKVWEAEETVEPQPEPEAEYVEPEAEPEVGKAVQLVDSAMEAIDFCPKCDELGFKNGICPHCGYHETVTCPKGLNKPLEKEEEICRDCGHYKRAWGDRPAACKWEGWK